MPVGIALCALLCLTSALHAAAPVIREAKVVTTSFIELDWQGTEYIQNAGRSKENTAAVHNNFEVRLNGTALGLNTSVPSWYWNITNLSLHGVRVNQNKTTLRLATALTSAQMAALQNGTSAMTVRITSATVTGADGAAANTTTTYPVAYKPYYTNTVTSKAGVPVRGSEFVLLRTVQQAADMVDVILSAMPENVLATMRTRNQFVIFGPGEHSYNIPEHRSIFLTDAWNRAEGYGGNTAATSAANVERHHNIPAAQRPYESTYASGYRNESILAHEFGHGVHGAMPSAMSGELTAIYNSAIATPENPANPTGRKKWDNSYAGGNASEYIATATATWFDAMNETASWGGTYGPLNYREELRRYDTPFYNFLTRIYPETRTLSTAWGSGVPNASAPVYAPEPAEPTGRYGPSVKIKNTSATNSAGSGINAYIPFNAAANTVPNVELWWDGNTNLMRWYLDPDASESWFRIRKKIERNDTQNQQNGNLTLMPTGSATTAGTRIVLGAVSSSDESQWWNFTRQANGSFIIANKSNSQMVLALENNTTASGTHIVLAAQTSASRFWNIDGNVPLNQPNTAIASNDRTIPRDNQATDGAVVAPVSQLAAEFTAGPNPVSKSAGKVNFFRQSKRVDSATLTVYDVTGNFIRKVTVSDKATDGQLRRVIGAWDLKDSKGRLVSEGTYLIKGVLKSLDGKTENVSVILGVR